MKRRGRLKTVGKYESTNCTIDEEEDEKKEMEKNGDYDILIKRRMREEDDTE